MSLTDESSRCQCLVLLLIGSPVHDESVRDDHLLQIVLIVSGDTEQVQLVALLVVGDLEQGTASWHMTDKTAISPPYPPGGGAPLHPRTPVTRVRT